MVFGYRPPLLDEAPSPLWAVVDPPMTEGMRSLRPTPIPDAEAGTRLRVGPLRLDRLSREEILERVFGGLGSGVGGWILTPNLHFCRLAAADPDLRQLFSRADLTIADGTPLVWSSRLSGAPGLERIPGSDLVWELAGRAATEDRSVYLLGGGPGVAEAAARAFCDRFPELRNCGHSDRPVSERPTQAELSEILIELRECRADIVFVALGAPKQERVCLALRSELPAIWVIGVGGSLDFVAGRRRRAPSWVQRCGLEWLHRFRQEPVRLGRRYLLEDLPYALRLLLDARRSRPR